ncbi:MAG: hypothetical protein COB53_08475 [Elusimicrobia bacterium]|nr:MAG: hypothetical protein COB53_08475 [Elusimicrobiota bacterium]
MSGAFVSAQTIGTSARHMEQGSWRVVTFYEAVNEEELDFDIEAIDSCTAETGTAGAFPCGGNRLGLGSGESFNAKLLYQPGERMQYYVSLGAGNYRLRTASVTVTNSLSGDRVGFRYGAGFKTLIMSETIVTPAVALDAGISMERYFFNRLAPVIAAGDESIDERLDLQRIQIAIEASKRFKISDAVTLEPYGGLKWIRTQSWIKDLASGGRRGGVHNTASPFVGLSAPIFGNEGFFAEASFVDGIRYALGLTIGFGSNEKK